MSDTDLHRLEVQRRANRAGVAALGLDPYGSREDGVVSMAQAHACYDAGADAEFKARPKDAPASPDPRPVVSVAGRVMLARDNGKLIWLNLRDETGDLQVAVSQRDCADPGFALAKATDLGDLVVARGPLVKTRAGETTIWASSLVPAAKCLVPPPEKHAGLHDVEIRYRRRYVDLWANPETVAAFRARSKIITALRAFLDERGFLEVDTPTLQTLAGGAAARPFVTHLHALDIDLFLRVSNELYLKRLLVGGLARVYEIARDFRNEGMDRSHNPEFSMVEIYERFGDYSTMLTLTESLVRSLARVARASTAPEASGPLRLPFGDLEIDYDRPFERVTYEDLFQRAFGFSMWDEAGVRAAAGSRGIETRGVDPIVLVGELFDEAEETLDPARPTFVKDYPAALCPLTRAKKDRPEIAERFELFIGGMELANAYTELNDPDVQEARFRQQLAGLDDEESTFRTFDEDFVHALKVGMPPAGGLGVGIDRLVMLLTNQRSIRDVILFPLMRPDSPAAHNPPPAPPSASAPPGPAGHAAPKP